MIELIPSIGFKFVIALAPSLTTPDMESIGLKLLIEFFPYIAVWLILSVTDDTPDTPLLIVL
jgi:hypothetical protein